MMSYNIFLTSVNFGCVERNSYLCNMNEAASPTVASPSLYLIPVGMSDAPLSDVLPQFNIDVIRRIRHFIVEDLRSARRFLKRVDKSIDIDSLTFVLLNEHTPAGEVASMLDPMKRGEDVAVMSEAGCPAVADPGALAVAEAQRRGYRVKPLVGPSSILLALMASGFNGQSFTFRGYLPIDQSARAAAMQDMTREITRRSTTQIFIETPYRNNRLIAELATRLPGEMLLCVAADITGPGERIITRPLKYWRNADYDYGHTPTIFLLYHS